MFFCLRLDYLCFCVVFMFDFSCFVCLMWVRYNSVDIMVLVCIGVCLFVCFCNSAEYMVYMVYICALFLCVGLMLGLFVWMGLSLWWFYGYDVKCSLFLGLYYNSVGVLCVCYVLFICVCVLLRFVLLLVACLFGVVLCFVGLFI